MPRKENQEFIKEIINELEDEYQHYITVDKERASYIYTDLGVYKEILKDLERLETLEKENQELKIENEAYIEQGTYVINQLNKFKKAIEIIKTKRVDIIFFMACGSLKEYNLYNKNNELTQQEYELLKEVLE